MDSGTTRSRKRGSYHHGDLKRALVDEAAKMIEERGDWTFSMRELAARIGVSPMATYSHFADKTELLATIAEEGFFELEARTRAASDATADPYDALFEGGLAYIMFGVERPARYRLMFGATFAVSQPASLRAACDNAFSVLTKNIADCAPQDGWPEGEAKTRALQAWAKVHGFTMLMIDRPARRLDDIGTAPEEIRPLAEAILKLSDTAVSN